MWCPTAYLPKPHVILGRQRALPTLSFLYCKRAVMAARKWVPNHIMANKNNMPFWHMYLIFSVRRSLCGSENYNINSLGVIRCLTNHETVPGPHLMSPTRTQLRKWCTQTFSIFSPIPIRLDFAYVVRLHFHLHSHLTCRPYSVGFSSSRHTL